METIRKKFKILYEETIDALQVSLTSWNTKVSNVTIETSIKYDIKSGNYILLISYND